MYLLDTNVISKARKINTGKIPDCFVKWWNDIDLMQCYLSALTIFEIELGILQKARKDPIQGEILTNWLENQIKVQFNGRILPYDMAMASKTAPLHIPDSKALVDSMIASTALQYDFVMVTDNQKDFVDFKGLKLLNPFIE